MAGYPAGSTAAMRIAMVSYADLAHDSRVQREADALARAGHAVTLLCLAAPDGPLPGLDPHVRVVVVRPRDGGIVPGGESPYRTAGRGRIRRVVDRVRWLIGYARTLHAWGAAAARAAGRVDAWHAHDFTGIAAVAGHAGHARLVYDVHDLFLEAGIGGRLPGPVRSILARYEGRLARRADVVVTVNEALAEVIERRYRPRRIVVVHNCPPRWSVPEPRPDRLREAAGIPGDAPVILYHGVLGANRGLDTLLAAILEPGLERAHLAMLGYGTASARIRLDAAAPRYGGRAHVLDPVPPAELLPWVASADVGAMVLPRATLNLYLSTPNKLFECLAAGVPAVVSDFPAMRAIVLDERSGPLGVTCDPTDIPGVARAFRSILERSPGETAALRARCATAARERWNWETEVGNLLAIYARTDTASLAATGPGSASGTASAG